MCLITRQNEPLIAEEDIIVFKNLKNSGNNDYVSPYQGFHFEINKIYTDTKESHIQQLTINSDPAYSITQGWFHSYSTLDGATKNCIFHGDVILVKAMIPKGTPYYLGICGDVCSKRIKLIEVCV